MVFVLSQTIIKQKLLGNKQKYQKSSMNHPHSRAGTHSHSLNHRGADDIKKGLQKIKQAQIEVLRQLRKDDTQLSRNHSLTYSKQTTLDSKPNLKFDGESVLLKQKLEKLQQELSDCATKEAKLKKQCLLMGEETKKWKEAASRAQYKMKEYEKSEQRALAKAQEGLANAITSEKKYIGLKTEYDKINKQRERLTYELKRLQKKQLSQIINSHENQSHIPNKVMKELISAQQLIHDLVRDISNHKCIKKQAGSSSSKNIQPPPSVNSFTISTFETQEKLDKNINNVILYLSSFQSLPPIKNIYQSNNYMSGSFRDDMRKIQQELDQASKGKNEKIDELQSTIQQISRKNSKLQAQLREFQQQNSVLKTRLKTVAKELEDSKMSRMLLEDEYEKFKKNTGEKLRLNREQFQEYKSKYNLSTSASAHADKSKKSNPNSNNSQAQEPLLQKIAKLEKQNQNMQQSLSSSLLQQQYLKQIIQKLEMQVELSKTQKQTFQEERKHELNKLAIHVQAEKNNNRKNYEEWDEMVKSLSRIQEQRMELINKEKAMNSKFEHEQKKYKVQVENLEQELEQLKKEMEEMRRESIAISFDQVDLLRLRNKENANKESLIFNQTVHDLWNQKQGEFNNLNNLLTGINPQSKQPLPKVQRVQQSQQQQQALPIQQAQQQSQQIQQTQQTQQTQQIQGQGQGQVQVQVQVQGSHQLYSQQVQLGQQEQRNNYPQQYNQQVAYRSNIPANPVSLVQVFDNFPNQPNPQQYLMQPVQLQPVHYPYQQFHHVQPQFRQGYPQGYYLR